MPSISLKKFDAILFQGDSVTEGGRNTADPSDLGHGYVRMIRDKLSETHTGHHSTLLIRGISGNRAADLAERWDTDCIALKPDVVTILVGINDMWHQYAYKYERVTAGMFHDSYEEILEKTKSVTDRIILMEPFLLPADDEMPPFKAFPHLVTSAIPVKFRGIRFILHDDRSERFCIVKADFLRNPGIYPFGRVKPNAVVCDRRRIKV